MSERVRQFYTHEHQVFALSQAQQALEWDQEVLMPPKGLQQSAQQLSALVSVIHGR
jgi:carboxypeptidase Taq